MPPFSSLLLVSATVLLAYGHSDSESSESNEVYKILPKSEEVIEAYQLPSKLLKKHKSNSSSEETGGLKFKREITTDIAESKYGKRYLAAIEAACGVTAARNADGMKKMMEKCKTVCRLSEIRKEVCPSVVV